MDDPTGGKELFAALKSLVPKTDSHKVNIACHLIGLGVLLVMAQDTDAPWHIVGYMGLLILGSLWWCAYTSFLGK